MNKRFLIITFLLFIFSIISVLVFHIGLCTNNSGQIFAIHISYIYLISYYYQKYTSMQIIRYKSKRSVFFDMLVQAFTINLFFTIAVTVIAFLPYSLVASFRLMFVAKFFGFLLLNTTIISCYFAIIKLIFGSTLSIIICFSYIVTSVIYTYIRAFNNKLTAIFIIEAPFIGNETRTIDFGTYIGYILLIMILVILYIKYKKAEIKV